MILNLRKAGIMQIPNGLIGIGDPGYSEVEYNYTVEPGEYCCRSWTGYEKGWGTRVWMSEIILNNKEALELAEDDKNWLEKGIISVDAGMAGYFINKPTFNEEKDWMEFCNWTFTKKNQANRVKSSYLRENVETEGHLWSGFWTESGIGDGCYPVGVLKNKLGKIVGIRIKFD